MIGRFPAVTNVTRVTTQVDACVGMDAFVRPCPSESRGVTAGITTKMPKASREGRLNS